VQETTDLPDSFIPVRFVMVIVFNPVAGRRRAALLWRVLDVLVANGVRLDVAQTHCAGHAAALAREAVAGGAPMVVAAGGDGTIAEVASVVAGTKVPLGVIPLGSANVLAHELSLPFTPRAVAAALAFRRTRRVWPGVMHAGNDKRVFVQMLSVGFDAQVVHQLQVPLKQIFGRGAYVLHSLREAMRYRYPPITVRLDGQEMQAANVIVSKGRFYGGHYLLAPDARPAERGFSVVLFSHRGPGAMLLYGAALPIDMLGRAPGVTHIRARRVEVVGNEAIPAQADGDAVGFTPLSVIDADGPIEVVVE
jgi:YegS/Rv2252/BmrU family lipid kinase